VCLARAEGVPPEVRLAWAGAPRVWVLARADGSFDKAFHTKVPPQAKNWRPPVVMRFS